MKKGGFLKSEKYYENGHKSLLVAIGTFCTGCLGIFSIVLGSVTIESDIDKFKESVKTSPSYIEYVEEKTAEYDEALYAKEISPEDYIAKINDLSDMEAYLKSDADPAQMATYNKLNKTLNDYTFGMMGASLTLIGIGAVAFAVSAGYQVASNIARKKENVENGGNGIEEESVKE